MDHDLERRPLTVLIVEDSASDAAQMVRLLARAGHAVHELRVDDEAGMRQALQSQRWDLLLSDFNVPGFGALKALALLQQSALDIPFIVVSGVIGEEQAVDLMRSGAHDYVSKQNLARLVPAVARELQEAASRARRRQAETALQTSEASLCIAQATARLGSWTLDLANRRVEGSEEFMRILGLAGHSSPLGFCDWMARVHPDDRQAFRSQHGSPPGAQTDLRQDMRLLVDDGSLRWVESRARLARDDAGQPLRWVGTLQDVSERKSIEAELARRAQELEQGRGALLQALADQRIAQAALRRHTEELTVRNDALTRFNRVSVDRELRMIELKQEINALLADRGEAPRYADAALSPAVAPREGPP